MSQRRQVDKGGICKHIHGGSMGHIGVHAHIISIRFGIEGRRYDRETRTGNSFHGGGIGFMALVN